MPQPDCGWEYYTHPSGWFYDFVNHNPRFNNESFTDFVIAHNRGDRDSGELGDIALHEVLRLAYEWEEHRWRFENVHGPAPVPKDFR